MAFFEDSSITHAVETVAAFRAWASKIHKALEECGLVNTADTGQINLTTVELPAESAFAGYEIWRFPTDAQQEADPIYIKLEYGRGAAKTRTNLRMTIGSGSDGAGNLTGTTTAFESKSEATSSAGTGYIHACLYKGAFHLIASAAPKANESNTHFLFIERMKNPAYEYIGVVHAGTGTMSNEQSRAGSKYRYLGNWTTPILIAPAGSPAGPYVGFGYAALCEPLGITAARRTTLGFVAGVAGEGETGKIELHGEEITYKRLPIEKIHTYVGGAAGATGQNHNILAMHQ